MTLGDDFGKKSKMLLLTEDGGLGSGDLKGVVDDVLMLLLMLVLLFLLTGVDGMDDPDIRF